MVTVGESYVQHNLVVALQTVLDGEKNTNFNMLCVANTTQDFSRNCSLFGRPGREGIFNKCSAKRRTHESTKKVSN